MSVKQINIYGVAEENFDFLMQGFCNFLNSSKIKETDPIEFKINEMDRDETIAKGLHALALIFEIPEDKYKEWQRESFNVLIDLAEELKN